MPTRIREQHKRLIAQSHHDLQRALGRIKPLEEQFRPVHPDHAALLQLTALGIMQCQEALLQFWELSWGARPKDVDKYRR